MIIFCLKSMNKTILICLIFTGIISSRWSFGQSLFAEVNGMESVWSISGSFNANLSKTSKISFSNISRFGSDYLAKEDLHMMIMTTLGYAITPKLKSTIGEIYTDGGGIKPSIGLQYMVVRKHVLLMLFPNLNISRQSELMTISMIQYLRSISEKLKFVGRIQSLCIVGSAGHLFSTFRFRSGIISGKYQFGAAADMNFFGNEFALAQNFGMFVQYQLF